jgi:hypothetical protein
MDRQLLTGTVFLIYSVLFMIFIAAAGYFVTSSIFKIIKIFKYATDEEGEEDQERDGKDLRP